MKFSIRLILLATLVACFAIQYYSNTKKVRQLSDESSVLATEIAELEKDCDEVKLRSAIYGGSVPGMKRLIQQYDRTLQKNRFLIDEVSQLQDVDATKVTLLKMLGIEDNFLASYRIYLPEDQTFYLNAVPSDCEDLFFDCEPQSAELTSGTSRLLFLFGDQMEDSKGEIVDQFQLLILQDDRVVARFATDKPMPDCRVKERLDADAQQSFEPGNIPMLMKLSLESRPFGSKKHMGITLSNGESRLEPNQ